MTGQDGADNARVVADGLNVTYQRGATPAVQGLGFRVDGGAGLLVCGDHGVGKTTVLRAVAGLVRYGGDIRVDGALPGSRAASRVMGFGPQGKAFMAHTTPRRIVGLVGSLRTGRRDGEAVAQALRAAAVPDTVVDRRVTDAEVIRRVSLACAIVASAQVVLLDDPWEFPETHDAIARVIEGGGSVIVATHDPGGFASGLQMLRLAEEGGE